MQDIPAQLHAIRKTTMGEVLITFRVDELYTESVQDLFLKKIGTEFVMKLEDVTTNTVLGGGKNNADTKERFFAQLHAAMREYTERDGMSYEEVKAALLKDLQKKGINVESTKELNIKELAIAIGTVKKWLQDEIQ